MGVSVPLAWNELDKLSGSAQWTISAIPSRLGVGNDPWSDYAPQAIGRAMATFGFKQAEEKYACSVKHSFTFR